MHPLHASDGHVMIPERSLKDRNIIAWNVSLDERANPVHSSFLLLDFDDCDKFVQPYLEWPHAILSTIKGMDLGVLLHPENADLAMTNLHTEHTFRKCKLSDRLRVWLLPH